MSISAQATANGPASASLGIASAMKSSAQKKVIGVSKMNVDEPEQPSTETESRDCCRGKEVKSQHSMHS